MDSQVSHDLEDFVAVIEGRETLLQEIAESHQELRQTASTAIQSSLARHFPANYI